MCSEWPLIPLRDFVDLLAGFAFKSTGYSDGQDDVRLLRGDNIAPGRVRWDGVKRWSRENAVGLERYALEPGDVVLAMDRPWIPAGLKVAQVQAADTPSYLVQRVARIRPASREDCSFLFALLSTPEFESYIQNVTTGTAVPHISAKQILDFEFRLPPAYVRAKVGEIVAALNERITLLRETNTTLEAMAQALFKSWFVDFDPVHARARGEQPAGLAPEVAALFPDSFEESALGMIPKGWNTGTLGDVAHFQNGYAFKSKDWCESGHPVVKIGDVKSGIIDFSGCSYIAPETTEGLSRFKLRRGDLLVGMTGYVGETGLVPHVEPHAYLNQRVGRIATKSGLIDLGFVYCLVRNSAFKGYAEARSHGSAQANVSGAVLLDYPVVTPTQNILDRFNGSVGVLLERILSNIEQAQTLANLRDTLLPRLISGQLRLPDAEQQLKDLAV